MKFKLTVAIALIVALKGYAQTEVKKEFYPNGKLMSETPYNNGKINGVKKLYYESGKLERDATIIDDKFNGIAKSYYESGALESETLFKNDKINGIAKSYYESGELEKETPYKNDEINGLEKTYYKSGKIETETPYKNDKIDGLEKLYYESGKIEIERQYINGQSYISKSYYENGKIEKIQNFKKGDDGHNGVKIYYESGELQCAIEPTSQSETPINKNTEILLVTKFYKNGKIMSKLFLVGRKKTYIPEEFGLEYKCNLLEKNYYDSGELESEIEISSLNSAKMNTLFISLGLVNGYAVSNSTETIGLFHGMVTLYYENGKIKSTTEYLNGKKKGE